MSEKKIMNRWLVVVGAMLIQLCLGAIYAWSVFTPYLTGTSPDPVTTFNFTSIQSQVVFSTGLATLATVMILAGRWQLVVGPRIIALSGGILLGIGYILASFIGKNFIGQVISIGLIAGSGTGLAYVCPISVGMKWFPEKKGLITGLAVAGFGFGALIWIKMGDSWGHLIASHGVLKVFLIYGITFMSLVVFGSMFMVNPPAGWAPPGWQPPIPSAIAAPSVAAGTNDFTAKQMMRTKQFCSLWVAFIFSSMAGLMTIGIIKLFGIDTLQKSGYSVADASAIAGTAMGVFMSISNGLGRIIWGVISDSIGRKRSIFINTLTQAIMMLCFCYLGRSEYLFYFAATIIGFNFGGNFSLFPTVTADYFGTKNVGVNYGFMFTAYGVGGIIGPMLAGVIKDQWKNFQAAFIIAGVACLLAAVIALIIKAPQKQGRKRRTLYSQETVPAANPE